MHAELLPRQRVLPRPGVCRLRDRLLLRRPTTALAYDVAVALNAWCFKREADGSFNVTAARAFVAGYERRRPLTPAERHALPVLAPGAALRFFLTRLNDWGATPEGALVRPKDPLEYERKLAVHRAGIGLFEIVP